jgi:hypothetical protein
MFQLSQEELQLVKLLKQQLSSLNSTSSLLTIMLGHTYNPKPGLYRNSSMTLETKVSWTSKGRTKKVSVKNISTHHPSQSPVRSPSKRQKKDSDLHGEDGSSWALGDDSFQLPLRNTKTKVCFCVLTIPVLN